MVVVASSTLKLMLKEEEKQSSDTKLALCQLTVRLTLSFTRKHLQISQFMRAIHWANNLLHSTSNRYLSRARTKYGLKAMKQLLNQKTTTNNNKNITSFGLCNRCSMVSIIRSSIQALSYTCSRMKMAVKNRWNACWSRRIKCYRLQQNRRPFRQRNNNKKVMTNCL